jgi:5-oxoprolinase (ATP-hydrolysing)
VLVRSRAMWHVRIDTGGTFTDAVGFSPTGSVERLKILSSARLRVSVKNGRVVIPGNGVLGGVSVCDLGTDRPLACVSSADASRGWKEVSTAHRIVELVAACDAPVLAMHLLTGTPLGERLPPIDLRIATTRGTNALLTNTLDSVLLITTAGFEDLPIIGNQARDDIFQLNPSPRRLLPKAVLGIAARCAVDGGEMVPLDEEVIAERAVGLSELHGIDSIAIVLLHSWINSDHECRLADACRRRGLTRLSLSHVCAPGIGLVPRLRTTLANASLFTTIDSFTNTVTSATSRGTTLFMNSAGALRGKPSFPPCESLLSGPAAGVFGAVASAQAMQCTKLIAFDMGGTSTDVSRFDGRIDLSDETEVGPTVVRVPSVALETVAAGGGSICTIIDGRLSVGPASAGAAPGPACYGAGGPLCLTDVNLLLHRLDPDRFGIPLDPLASTAALASMLEGTDRDATATLEGFLTLANEHMADAIRTLTIKQGEDPADHTLVAFGGAGPQHACAVAERLDIRRIVIPANTGLLSAVGLHGAGRSHTEEVSVLKPLDSIVLGTVLDQADRLVLQRAERDGIDCPVILRRQVRCRLEKQETTIDLEFDESNGDVARQFAHAFRDRFGYEMPERAIELASVRVFAGTPPTYDILPPECAEKSSTTSEESIERASIKADPLDGPLLILEPTATTVLQEGWSVRRDPSGALLLQREEEHARRVVLDAVTSEVTEGRLESIARDMGESLRRTALSVNVRERLDYSCAVLDGDGQLIVNAPHMPVHLGAMGVCVRAVAAYLDLQDGDTALVNHPAFGGSHLPDLTLVTPVFQDGKKIAYVANRAHHAEIGGTRPGSMPPDATSLAEEGVVFEPVLLVRGGKARFDVIEKRLRSGVWPSRLPNDNLADLAAQLAANTLGVRRVQSLVRGLGHQRFVEELADLRTRCASTTSAIAQRFSGLDWTGQEVLDDGSVLAVRVKCDGSTFLFDFKGTTAQHHGNLNAPHAVTRAAVLYVLRLLAAKAIPLNEGTLADVHLRLPEGSMLNPVFTGTPERDPAVAIGNTETSQRIVDVLLRAFNVAACSQGTMNNTLLGSAGMTYYETVCGGAGATSERAGCDAIHTHMTNTRITDPEVLEHVLPVRLRRFALREGSGGEGHHRGGEGVVREWEARATIDVSILAQHRVNGPYGIEGGGEGACGRQWLKRANGTIELLGSSDSARLEAGDRFCLETPGGGGWGTSLLKTQTPTVGE